MIDRLARLRLFGAEDESGVSGDTSVALAPKRTVTPMNVEVLLPRAGASEGGRATPTNGNPQVSV